MTKSKTSAGTEREIGGREREREKKKRKKEIDDMPTLCFSFNVPRSFLNS